MLCADRDKAAARMMRVPVVVGCMVLTLCGCASLALQNSASVTVDVPAAWSVANVSTKTGTSSLTQWWLRFDDPLLGSLVTQALQTNTSVKSAQAALRQARALSDVAAAGLLPIVASSASAQHSTGGGKSAGNNFTAGLDASWELDIFGANRSALDASNAVAEASAASLGDVQVSIAAEVALAYITLRGAQSRLGVCQENPTNPQKKTPNH